MRGPIRSRRPRRARPTRNCKGRHQQLGARRLWPWGLG
jgi:hypothetical protein